MLRKICQEQTSLNAEDISRLEQVESQLTLMAELTGADVFIDCMTKDGAVMVVAQAKPSTLGSAYQQDVVGKFAQPENEPAVFQALQTGTPARDIKAVTQENQSVRQDVVPILNGEGKCIAALIREKDITGALLQGKSLYDASRIAADFVCMAIEHTEKNPAHWYGVKFETVLGELSRLVVE